ncbi:bifunctional allantoicase/(S)-ureidoglycine aminohydrolase [uncultured Litoreibacter sp.]|uniref:bifunctional allantoicase/(S)-ureidoglycine aminohydrolase n=1 Tax=uncultured Litoreibacter sp. TaxID=1392394 RepID=UPI002610C44C|nr:bifunctional allantoicase/(S)-ureidoglycine aminohydrolase [uncultured Litoreibacter sp.]
MMAYATPMGGLPKQTDDLTGKAVFTEAYAFLPAGTMRDIVTSYLPGWDGMRMWMIARPLSGFAETFSQYIVELQPGGGSDVPESNPEAQGVLFVTSGHMVLHCPLGHFDLRPGSYVFLPAGAGWRLRNEGDEIATFHWIRKKYQPAHGVPAPECFVTHDEDGKVVEMPNTSGKWSTTRFVEPSDLRHDFHVNIVNFQPGGVIPFEETHVMEHGLFVLEGTADYLLNRDWVSVGPGDFMWLRAFCPQACRATGEGPFRYLLYKDVNRHAGL